MEAPSGNSDSHRASSGNTNNRRYRVRFFASNFMKAPISSLEYSGLLRPTPRLSSTHQESDPLIPEGGTGIHPSLLGSSAPPSPSNEGEVSIRIIGASDQDHNIHHDRVSSPNAAGVQSGGEVSSCFDEVSLQQVAGSAVSPSIVALHGQEELRDDCGSVNGVSPSSADGSTGDTEAVDGVGVNNNRDSTYQRYDIQQAARWIEQVLPFSLLLLVVFIRQHLQGFFVTIWIAVVMFKSNDILRKQTALKAIPPFWHAVFIIMFNDPLVRQAAMVFKCFLLMYYKNGRGRNYRQQGQMLTLVEYLLLLYRALLPTPVWYRFFLNKEYGSLFSSLMTGLYLTFKLTTVVEKVQSFFAAVKALSRKDVHYGAYATLEQVNAAGDMCAICQEKMQAPILLCCKHIFCEDCVSEWFERERTCPLCRALVKPADIKSFGDGSTSLLFQLF